MTHDEIDDNIVAFWQPEKPARKGSHRQLDCRKYWIDEEPQPPEGARAVATRIGRSGVPAQHEKPDLNGRESVIDFAGGPDAWAPMSAGSRSDGKPGAPPRWARRPVYGRGP